MEAELDKARRARTILLRRMFHKDLSEVALAEFRRLSTLLGM